MVRLGKFIAALALMALPAVGLAQSIKTPPAEELTAMDTDLAGSDAGKKDAAVEKLKGWVKGGYVSDHVWRNWIPSLTKDTRNQDVADISLEAIMHRPDPMAAYTLITMRYQALSALKKDDLALQAAKSYFNVVQMTNTTRGVDALATMLGKAHPGDTQIVAKFRKEQTDAKAGTPLAADSILKSIKVDAAPYEEALKAYKDKTVFRDRIGYGDLLLLADKPAEAEAVFQELYKVAEGSDQLTQSGEGVAKAMRAADGHGLRAAAWWKTAQAEIAAKTASTQPAGAVTTRPATPVATRPATPRPARDPGMP